MPNGYDIDLSAVDKAAAEVEQQEALETCENDEVSTGHKVLFYVLMGVLCLFGVGVPVLIFLLIKKCNEVKKLKEEKAAESKAEVKTEESTEEPKTEEVATEEAKPEVAKPSKKSK